MSKMTTFSDACMKTKNNEAFIERKVGGMVTFVCNYTSNKWKMHLLFSPLALVLCSSYLTFSFSLSISLFIILYPFGALIANAATRCLDEWWVLGIEKLMPIREEGNMAL